MVQFEAGTESANIKTGNDALWWGIVTITTVGYGDRYPVTLLGRTTAFVVMLAGVGIIGALASILASLLVPPPPGDPEPATDSTAAAEGDAGVAAELAARGARPGGRRSARRRSRRRGARAGRRRLSRRLRPTPRDRASAPPS
jgi:hypothetical protein